MPSNGSSARNVSAGSATSRAPMMIAQMPWSRAIHQNCCTGWAGSAAVAMAQVPFSERLVKFPDAGFSVTRFVLAGGLNAGSSRLADDGIERGDTVEPADLVRETVGAEQIA